MSSWTVFGGLGISRKYGSRGRRLVQPAWALATWRTPAFWASRALHSHYFGQRARRRFGRRGRIEG